jgi:protein-S-isoprenylcysteine O-methyltransferase Ste14
VAFCAQSLVILYPGVFVFWFVLHGRIRHWRTMGKRAYWYACLGWPVIGSGLLFFRRSIFSVRWPMPWWIELIGLLAIAAAAGIGYQAAQTISRRTLIGLVELEPDRNPQPVMQSGIYSKTRNPIYLAHWLVILAAAAVSGYAANWTFLAVDSVLVGVLIRMEEKELIGRYGAAFESYMRRVPRFFPRGPW